MIEAKPSDAMRGIGIVQSGSPILHQPAQPLNLPIEHDLAAAIVNDLVAAMHRARRIHNFAKGMGIAAPQLGISRRAAVVQPPAPDAPVITLLNPTIISRSDDEDEQYEGCLSFFDVRGKVPRPLRIEVETNTPTGELRLAEYRDGLARLIQHEIDHLDGILYTARMKPTLQTIPVEQYRQTGRSWSYG
ncbi:peptide deformylase [Nocardia sp. NBC_00508]|uniref:peptide deformylase n=1 Tax=Nocardia sp. NBC_00508 TaxID=2975992 RepID=UPI002E809B7D|nr:peptide deformylase [Nocardia sp. NBC_00508]WUD65878.1 peptide deformylase [Nocardia sp. NBC_00508]